MISRLKLFIFASLALILGFTGWRVYAYLFSHSVPLLELKGIDPEAAYAGDTQIIVKGSDDYKVGSMSILLDGKPLLTNQRISKRVFEYPFTIPTKTLSNGAHTLKVELQNAAYHRQKTSQELSFSVDNQPLQAAFVRGDTDAKVFQGRTLHVQFQVNKEIKEANVRALSRQVHCAPESKHSLIYECFMPIDCEDVPNEYILSVDITDKVGNTLTLDTKFQVVRFPFKKQTLYRLNAEKIKAENEIGLPEKQLEQELEELAKKSPAQKLWQGVFYTPIDIKEPKQITTEFGVIRTTQERGLSQHKALDLYTAPKSVIWAPQDGIVVLKNRYAHSGNTVVIDHGLGVLSLLYHLDSFADVQIGEHIKKGKPAGRLGNTGYATGPHLHWEMRVNNIAIDPMEWTKHNF